LLVSVARGFDFRHASLQNLTSSQFRSHFFRQANGRPQVWQVFAGKFGLEWAKVVLSSGEGPMSIREATCLE